MIRWIIGNTGAGKTTLAHPEIEVTPEMIAAGAEAIWPRLMHDPIMSPGVAEDLAEIVLRAAAHLGQRDLLQGTGLCKEARGRKPVATGEPGE